MDRPPVPVNVVCGPLGAGKTTTVLEALSRRGPGERWAVLVNEFGSVGIDGAILSEADGIEIREIAGGCVCCVGSSMLRAALVRLIREVRPDRLLVEPSGLAHPASVLDHLRSAGLREAVDLRATIGLVHPRRLARADAELLERITTADVLVGTHADQLGEDELAAFRDRAARLWPAPMRVVTTSFGVLEPEILDLRPSPRAALRFPHAERPAVEHGWIWPAAAVFDPDRLVEIAQSLLRPEEGPAAARVKGLFRTERGWRLLQGTPDTVRITPSSWRRDSRVEVLAEGPVDWDAIDALWRSARASSDVGHGGLDSIEV